MASDSNAMLFIERGSSRDQNEQSNLEGQGELEEGESSGSHASKRDPALSANQVTFNERAQIIKQHAASEDDRDAQPYRPIQDLQQRADSPPQSSGAQGRQQSPWSRYNATDTRAENPTTSRLF